MIEKQKHIDPWADIPHVGTHTHGQTHVSTHTSVHMYTHKHTHTPREAQHLLISSQVMGAGTDKWAEPE